jgi:hypothetical protein
MNQPEELGFAHTFLPGSSTRTLLVLPGTGSNENDLILLGRQLDPDANLLIPRGKVLENGTPRFFRRLAEGIFDEEDLIRRTDMLADFIEQASAKYRLNRQNLFAVGYSNGAKIAGSLLLLRPQTLAGAILLQRQNLHVAQQLLGWFGRQRVVLRREDWRAKPQAVRSSRRSSQMFRSNFGESLPDNDGHVLAPPFVGIWSLPYYLSAFWRDKR